MFMFPRFVCNIFYKIFMWKETFIITTGYSITQVQVFVPDPRLQIIAFIPDIYPFFYAD